MQRMVQMFDSKAVPAKKILVSRKKFKEKTDGTKKGTIKSSFRNGKDNPICFIFYGGLGSNVL